MGPLEEKISRVLNQEFEATYLEVINESASHSRGGDETHFRVVLVSERFEGISRVKRQQMVYSFFKEDFQQGLHAFSQYLFTPHEWEEKKGQLASSPDCQGGGL